MADEELKVNPEALRADAAVWEEVGTTLDGLVKDLRVENIPRYQFGWSLGSSAASQTYDRARELVAGALAEGATTMAQAAESLRRTCDNVEAVDTATATAARSIASEFAPTMGGERWTK
jgi:hypothetical protein